jgi:hypothetical protein
MEHQLHSLIAKRLQARDGEVLVVAIHPKLFLRRANRRQDPRCAIFITVRALAKVNFFGIRVGEVSLCHFKNSIGFDEFSSFERGYWRNGAHDYQTKLSVVSVASIR